MLIRNFRHTAWNLVCHLIWTTGALIALSISAISAETVPTANRASASIAAPGVTPRDASISNESVMGLPYTTQWIYERTSSYVYFSYNSAQLRSSVLTIDRYSADFGDKSFGFPGFDLFNHIVSFSNPDSNSGLKDLSLWGRYSLGFADRKGSLSDSKVALDSNLEKSSLLIFTTRIGALLSYDHWSSFRPYAGIEVSPYFFRQSADISGAEQQGASYSYGPVLGAHMPLLFGGRCSILTEFRHSIAGNGSRIFGDSEALSAGVGLAL